MNNPFFTDWKTKYGAVPFDLIKLEHYMPAIEKGLEIAREKIKKIKENPEKPNFQNTIVAIGEASHELDCPVRVYFYLLGAESNNEFKTLAEKISPMLSQYNSEISTDEIIFDRVKSVYENMNNENLDDEQKRLLERSYKSFVRNGALLDSEKKKELLEINNQMSVLSPQFSKNLLNSTNAFSYHTTDASEVEGLSENDLKAAEFRAKQKNHESGWLFNLQAPSLIPVMTYAKNRELRKKINLAFNSRSFKDENDNQEIVLKQVKLRQKRANLLGYKTHADYVLEDRMAETPDTVNQFLDRIYKIAMPKAKEELEILIDYAKKLDGIEDFMPWDYAYYSEKLKKETFGFDTDELKPYFQAENCIQGIFKVAERLYGLNFVENKEIPLYHNDVKVYEVFDNKNNPPLKGGDNSQNFVGLLYFDLFPRETKNGGAWMNAFKIQGMYKGKIERPHITIVGNFNPSTADTPSLLSLNDVTTLFHEFGHALHGLLSNCTYTSLASPNTLWDFVELPSQIMENWVLEKDTLDMFAHHYKTGDVMPEELIKKVKAAENFNKGNFNIRQLSFGLLDMAWYFSAPDEISNVKDYESEAIEKLRLFPKIETACTSTAFAHIFAGGYSAGYYSYKWAEVLDADAYGKFQEEGIFNPETARSFRENILSKGNTANPMDLYVKFRGRKPDPDAMLKRDGLL
ncbi:MAG: M3 family metallopeptidase [Candidatus Cloacimonetes bacterium]|nr:M3 family metallopeptidase [Candidatus Cloacimonadota bacterium]